MTEGFALTWTIDQQHEGILVREFLKRHDISKTALTDIKFKGGDITVNGEHATVRRQLRTGDVLSVSFPPEVPSEGMAAQYIPLDIVYEDDYILVVNKPPFLPSIPSREHPKGTLSNALLHYYNQQGITSTVHLVNRLDRDTSGLLIVAKYRYVHYLFSKEQQRHTINRIYHALVHGTPAQQSGTIDAPIGRKSDSIIEREVREDGQKAITRYSVLKQSKEAGYVALKLETGRTHQIRVHMSYLGYPLLGDELYGGKRELIKRQALHSYELSFYHPILKKELSFAAEIPVDMKKVIETF